jgi:uncharacterized protein (DUF849 family)
VPIQACLNGSRQPGDHPAVPIALDELVRDARACAAAGAFSLHVHPRDLNGAETLDPALVDTTAGALRAASGGPIGVTTGAWIEPDPERRVALLAGWAGPDFASVNLREPGAADAMRTLLENDIGIEAGLETVADVDRLAASGLADRLLRVLVEVVDPDPGDAAGHALALDRALDAAGIDAPRLHHGQGAATWRVLEQAIRLGHDVRIGLEDVLTLPDGSAAPDNASLLHAAAGLR